MCTHFHLYLRGAQFTLRTDHRSLRWLQNFRNSDGMLVRWYMLLGQFSLTFEYWPGAQHANADGLSHQCFQCSRPDCPVSSPEGQARGSGSTSAFLDQLFASSAMGDSMHSDLLPELSGETWVTATFLEEVTGLFFDGSPLGLGVVMDILDMSVTTPKSNRYVLVMVDCFSRWTEACPLPNKTALPVADAFFQLIVCQFGMPAVIHSDQGQDNMMQELCILGGSHKTRTTPYHPAICCRR